MNFKLRYMKSTLDRMLRTRSRQQQKQGNIEISLTKNMNEPMTSLNLQLKGKHLSALAMASSRIVVE